MSFQEFFTLACHLWKLSTVAFPLLLIHTHLKNPTNEWFDWLAAKVLVGNWDFEQFLIWQNSCTTFALCNEHHLEGLELENKQLPLWNQNLDQKGFEHCCNNQWGLHCHFSWGHDSNHDQWIAQKSSAMLCSLLSHFWQLKPLIELLILLMEAISSGYWIFLEWLFHHHRHLEEFSEVECCIFPILAWICYYRSHQFFCICCCSYILGLMDNLKQERFQRCLCYSIHIDGKMRSLLNIRF